jgi:hypothetical protein
MSECLSNCRYTQATEVHCLTCCKLIHENYYYYTASLATLYKKDKLLQGWSLYFDKPSFVAPRKSLPSDATDGGAV